MTKLVLGLDVSTSCTGVCIIDPTVEVIAGGKHIRYLDTIQFKGCKTLWDKADVIEKKLQEFKNSEIGTFALEEPLLGFSKGMSSAGTITTLMRFNGIVSYIGRNVLGVEPTYLSAASARKSCGVKLVKRAVGGPQKEQVFTHMTQHDLAHVDWPKKKSGQPVDWSRDATDAYVIARAACLMHKKEDE